MNALILAAGIGKRLRPLTNTVPKALAPIMGVPLLAYQFAEINNTRFGKVFVNTHYLSQQVHSFLSYCQESFPTLISHELGQQLGTGGAIGKITPETRNEYLVTVNVDTINFRPVDDLISHAKRLKALVTMEVFPIKSDNPQLRKLIIDQDGRFVDLKGFCDPEAGNHFAHVYFTGRAVIHPQALELFPQTGIYDSIDDIYIPLLKKDTGIRASYFDGFTLDTGDPDVYSKTQASIPSKYLSETIIQNTVSHKIFAR